MGPGDISFQERSGLGAGPRKGEDPACAWPLVGSVVGVSRVPVEHGTGPAWLLAPSQGLSGDCGVARPSPPQAYLPGPQKKKNRNYPAKQAVAVCEHSLLCCLGLFLQGQELKMLLETLSREHEGLFCTLKVPGGRGPH